MIRNTLNTSLFRIAFPFLYGLIVYLLVLVFFGSAELVLENFFNQEAFICILIAYVLAETLLILHKKAFKIFSKNTKLFFIALVFSSVLLSLVVVSSAIALYFEYILDLSVYKRELMIFNLIYGISAVLYSLVWISVFLIQKEEMYNQQKQMLIEKILKEEFNELIYQTEPDLLYSTLEHILSQMATQPERADDTLNNLSAIYRYKLEANELNLISLEEEFKNTQKLVYLLNLQCNHKISLESTFNSAFDFRIKPFTLFETVKKIVRSTIVNEISPLNIKLGIDDKKLFIHYYNFPKLRKEGQLNFEHPAVLNNNNQSTITINLEQ